LKKRIRDGLPVLRTYTGLALHSNRSYDKILGETKQPFLACLDVNVERNAFGREGKSFEGDVEVPLMGGKMKAVAIRAPLIKEVGSGVEVPAKADHDVLAVRQGNVVVTVFHPELSSGLSFRRYLVRKAAE
jgi:5'-phosphate synthase pdxT subunit